MNSFNTSQVILYRGMDFKFTKTLDIQKIVNSMNLAHFSVQIFCSLLVLCVKSSVLAEKIVLFVSNDINK